MRLPARRSVHRIVLLASAIGIAPSSAASAALQAEAFPEDKPGAIRVFEEETAPKDWANGPVEYIMLGYERDIWNDLGSDPERQAFIEWFWGRRDDDPRDETNKYRDEFYTRVAFANQRFTGFPRGWKSDRGRVHIILGRPAGVRRTGLAGWGRCAAESGELWTYYTNDMAFSNSFGEFFVVFVETRIGEYEICDPTMLGRGAMPVDLRSALQITNEAGVLDDVTEFAGGSGARRAEASASTRVRTIEGEVRDLDVPLGEWGAPGIGGAVVVPLEIPLRDLLFEPQGESLRAKLAVEATLVALGEAQGRSGTQEWVVDIGSGAAEQIAGASLRTALVLPAEPGGYSVRVRVTDPLSAINWVWDGAVEVSAEGAGATPPLIGNDLIQLRADGEVAVLAASPPRLSPGAPFATVTWVRGAAPDPAAVSLVLVDAASAETTLEIDQAAWGNQAAAGPLIVQSTLPDLPAGRYVLRLDLGGDLSPVERVFEVR